MAHATRHRPATCWVEAAPFRAHVRHLCATTGLPWPVLAMRAGVSLALVDHLLHGREGRTPRRITRTCAARLLAVTQAGVSALAVEGVHADAATRLAGVLQRRGWSAAEVADAADVPPGVVQGLLDGVLPRVTVLDELRLRALVAASDRGLVLQAAA